MTKVTFVIYPKSVFFWWLLILPISFLLFTYERYLSIT